MATSDDVDSQVSAQGFLGRYQILDKLGSGGCGVVYKALDPQLHREVAIKALHSGVDQEFQRELLERFMIEARAVARLNHPHVVAVYDFVTLEGIPHLVMEFVPGGDLRTLLKQPGSLTWQRAVSIVDAVLDALQHAHAVGIVHRDIKPGNIFVPPNGLVKLADFGVARLENSEVTRTGSVIGTPSYMAPEQCQGLTVDARADLFSVGVVLYELVCQRKPFIGEHPTAVMHQVLTATPPAPRDLNPTLPPALTAIIFKAMAKSPAERFQSAREFRDALAALVANPAAAPLVTPSASADVTLVNTPKPSRLHSPLMALVAGAAVAAMGLGIFSALRAPADAPVSVTPAAITQTERCALPADHCRLLDALQPWTQASRMRVSLIAGDAMQLQEGQSFALQLVTPEYPAYVYVIYVQADGTLMHLMTPDGAPHTPGSRIILGDGQNGRDRYTVAPPLGDELVVTLASQHPLWPPSTAIPAQITLDEFIERYTTALKTLPDGNTLAVTPLSLHTQSSGGTP